jgi:hypothetical protein
MSVEFSHFARNETYCKPLSIIRFANAEESLKGVITRNDESGKIGKKLTSDVEEDKEEISGKQAKEGIYFRDRGLLLQVIQNRILG